MSCLQGFEERSTRGGLPQPLSLAFEGISFAFGHKDSGGQFGQELCAASQISSSSAAYTVISFKHPFV